MRLHPVTRYRLADGRTLAQPFDVRKRAGGDGFRKVNQPLGFAFSPNPTRRRMISGFAGMSGCLRLARNTLSARTISIRASSARSRRCIRSAGQDCLRLSVICRPPRELLRRGITFRFSPLVRALPAAGWPRSGQVHRLVWPPTCRPRRETLLKA